MGRDAGDDVPVLREDDVLSDSPLIGSPNVRRFEGDADGAVTRVGDRIDRVGDRAGGRCPCLRSGRCTRSGRACGRGGLRELPSSVDLDAYPRNDTRRT